MFGVSKDARFHDLNGGAGAAQSVNFNGSYVLRSGHKIGLAQAAALRQERT